MSKKRPQGRQWPKGHKVQVAHVGKEGQAVKFPSGSVYVTYKGSLRRVFVGKANGERAIKVNGVITELKDLDLQ